MVFVCLQSILKYWTTNSYILCAMYGENLFNTLSQANSQIFRNSLRFLAFTEVTDLFINVNIVGVVLMNLGVTFIIFPIQMDKVESQVVVLCFDCGYHFWRDEVVFHGLSNGM